MIYESLIAPSEFPIENIEIKRALLTYDKVKLIEPTDRDLMPSNTFMSTILGLPIMSFDTGPIRPMGKVSNYDSRFELLVDEIKPAVDQGLVETITTYDKSKTKGITIGAVPTGGYPLNTKFIYSIYRRISQDQGFLKSAISEDRNELIKLIRTEDKLVLKGGGDGKINNIPALPLLVDENLSDLEKENLTQIARSRLASFIKYAGFSEQKNLVPIFPSQIYGSIAFQILRNTKTVLSEIEDDQFWTKRNRILELCHEEYLVDEVLSDMSIKDVLKLRTKIWGKQAEARENLFSSITKLSFDIDEDQKFIEEARNCISTYRKTASELELERKNLKFKIKCDIGTGVLGSTVSITGLLNQLQSPISSIGLTLAAGGIWALEKSKEHIPILRKIKSQEEELKRGAGLGIQNFYSKLR